jgi:hypothetical protein
MSQSSKAVFYLSIDRLERIRREPHLGWDLFPSTRLDVYAPRVHNSDLKLEGVRARFFHGRVRGHQHLLLQT